MGKRSWRVPEPHTALLGCRNPLSLSAANILPFILSHKGKYLQNKVGNEGAEQIFVTPCVQQWHIQHKDVYALFLGNYPPLFQNLLVISAKPVNACNSELLTRPELF